MPEMFAGHWGLLYAKTDTERQNRLVVEGSGQADGTYPKAIGQDLALDVDAELWSVDVQSQNPDTHEWESLAIRRTSRFDPTNGLMVHLETTRPSDGPGQELQLLSNVIECVYHDPDVNPTPTPDPFDFTYGNQPDHN